jgi:microcystin degradation protein MlrC
MRLALLGFSHETNTFAASPTTYDDFAASGILRGEQIVARHATAHTTVAGYLEAGRKAGVEVVPLLFAGTEPSGTITRDAYDRLTGEMLSLLESGGRWDGVLLAQHGAAVVEGVPDADGDFAGRVRRLVGGIPVGMALDMHANLSRQMVDATTVTVVYRTNPHVDPRPRARECAVLIARTVRGEVRPVQALATPPLVVNIVKQFTGEPPMQDVMADVAAVMARPGMLTASAVEGYPYADVAEMGMSFLAVHDGDVAAARAAARWLAQRTWDRREQLAGETPSPEAALRLAAAAPQGPVVIMDVGDNIGGGSPADSTILLAAARRLGVRSYLQTLCDPQAVAECVAAGVGADITLRVGAKTDRRHGEPVEITGRVRVLSDGTYEDPRPTHGGQRFFDAGTMAVLEAADDYTLVLTTRRTGNTSIEQMYSVGVRPERKQVVVAKGVVSPRPAYEPIAAQIILANTPGVTTADLSTFDYRRRRRPLYPFEREAAYAPDDG